MNNFADFIPNFIIRKDIYLFSSKSLLYLLIFKSIIHRGIIFPELFSHPIKYLKSFLPTETMLDATILSMYTSCIEIWILCWWSGDYNFFNHFIQRQSALFMVRFAMSIVIINTLWHPLRTYGWNLNSFFRKYQQWQISYSFDALVLLISIPSETLILSSYSIFILFIWTFFLKYTVVVAIFIFIKN